MGDAIKIAAKTALIGVITAGIIALFTTVQIPSLNFQYFSQALGTGLAVLYHYVPVAQIIFPVALGLLAFDVALRAFNLAMIAVRWVLKVNE